MRQEKSSVLLPALIGSAVILATRIYVIFAGAVAIDDAYITYRYAENIAAGNGFVYNLGEKVLGTTTPLYTLLLAFFNFIGLDVPTVSLIIGLLCSVAIGIVLFLFAQKLSLGKAALLAPMLYAFWPNAINCDISGMETPLFALGALSFFYLIYTARYRWAAVIAATLSLLRPEGIVLVCLFFGFMYLIKRKNVLIEALLVVAIILPWVIFAWSYFGSVIPNSVAGKLALYQGYETGTFWGKLYALFGFNNPLGWISTLAALWGLVYLLIRNYWGFLEAAFILGTFLPMAMSQTKIFHWYKHPSAPLMILFITAGAAGAYFIAQSVIRRPKLVNAITVIILIAAVPALGAQLERSREYQLLQTEVYANNHRRAGYYLLEHAKPDAVLVAEDIGHLGYIFRHKIIDRDGLVSPEAVRHNTDFDYSGLLREELRKHPGHWLFISMSSPTTVDIEKSGLLDSAYTLDTGFANFGEQDYLLFLAKQETDSVSAQ